jgi:hypothetical protein
VHKETAVACVRIVEDGDVALPANPFRGLAINA